MLTVLIDLDNTLIILDPKSGSDLTLITITLAPGYTETVSLRPGTVEFLHALRDLGCRIVLATMSGRLRMWAIVRALHLGFDAVMTREDWDGSGSIHRPDGDVVLVDDEDSESVRVRLKLRRFRIRTDAIQDHLIQISVYHPGETSVFRDVLNRIAEKCPVTGHI